MTNKNEQVARELSSLLAIGDHEPDFGPDPVKVLLDKHYPPLPGDIARLVEEGRELCEGYRVTAISLRDGSTTSGWEQLPNVGRELIERLCDALESLARPTQLVSQPLGTGSNQEQP